jgi:D-alanine-D-alanine ligase
MTYEFGKVAVLFGGNSAERDVSLHSGQAVLDALLAQNINAHGIDPKTYDVAQLKKDQFDRAFIVLHGRGGEDGTVQGLLTYLDIPFTGSGVLGSAIAMDKSKTKQIWQSYQLPTAPYQLILKASFNAQSAKTILDSLGGVAMVKPVNEGSSIGMAKVSTPAELIDALETAFKFDHLILLEAWITGEEYTVSMLNGEALPAIKMHTEHAFYDYKAKYESTSTQYFCPSGLSDSELSQLNQIAKQAFSVVGCEGWGRVDFMRDEQKNWYLLEVNTVPGMTKTSLVPKAAKQAGLTFEQLVVNVLKQTLNVR